MCEQGYVLYTCMYNAPDHTWPFLLAVLALEKSRVSPSRVPRIIVLCSQWKTLWKLHGNRPNAFHFEYRVPQRNDTRAATVKGRLR